jgi:hypothetical protein
VAAGLSPLPRRVGALPATAEPRAEPARGAVMTAALSWATDVSDGDALALAEGREVLAAVRARAQGMSWRVGTTRGAGARALACASAQACYHSKPSSARRSNSSR